MSKTFRVDPFTLNKVTEKTNKPWKLKRAKSKPKPKQDTHQNLVNRSKGVHVEAEVIDDFHFQLQEELDALQREVDEQTNS